MRPAGEEANRARDEAVVQLVGSPDMEWGSRGGSEIPETGAKEWRIAAFIVLVGTRPYLLAFDLLHPNFSFDTKG